MILSIVFLSPRLFFMIGNWDSSEREILLSKGPRDNPTMEHLREFYRKMYFIKDNTEEEGVLYFVEMETGLEEAYKILLPRKLCFIGQGEAGNLLSGSQKQNTGKGYLVFAREKIPNGVGLREVVWSNEGWGIWRVR